MPFYAVFNGKNGSEVHDNWPDAERAMKGKSNAKVKKFGDYDSATHFCTTGDYNTPDPLNPHIPTEALFVYTDGSALANGRAGAGVFFSDQSPYNLSEAFDTPPNTNQRAELWAAKRALEIINQHSTQLLKDRKMVCVCTDSKYVIGCATLWRQQWVATNFRQGTIANKDLVKQLWQAIDQTPVPIRWEWVKGHACTYGNKEADRLAGLASSVVLDVKP